MRLLLLLATLFGMSMAGPALAGLPNTTSDADIDPSFAPEDTPPGWHRMKVSLNMDRAVDFARQPDGHYVAAIAVPGGGLQQVALFRQNADGSADGDLLFYPGFTAVGGMTVDAQGRIIVVGTLPGPGGKGDIGIMRVTADGELDPDFGADGVVSFGFDTDSVTCDDAPTGVLAQADGRIVVVGNALYAGVPNRFSILRVNVDGTLDSTFGSIDDGMGGRKGSTDTFVAGDPAYASDVLEMVDGYFLVVGTSVLSDLDTDFAARIITPSGSEWSAYAGSDTFAIDFPGPGGSVYDTATAAVRVDSRTALIVGTASGRAAARRIRFGPANQLGQYASLDVDLTFVGNNPDYLYRYISDTPYYVNDAAVRADGSTMLVGRQASVEGGSFGYVERLLPDGGRDADFSFQPEATYVAPVQQGGDSYSTEFVSVLIDDSRPVLLGTAADSTSAATDTDGVITRLASRRVTPPPLFSDGFENTN